jgi:exodeoxyribonuclease VII large subunit
MKLNIQPKNGMKVLVRGRVGLYEPRGDYQLIAEHMEDAGIGQLQRQFEALKQKLSDAGLFAEEHKKEFPEYPKRIGVITSPTGAAVRDILQVLSRRSPHTPVLVYPVSVQGEASKTQIETAIRRANIDKKCDVLILARGGGSIEDLWSFNEENVAKAVYNSEIPIICGVGHEIDFTIADFVADMRAPTPSAAAELITPDRAQLLTDVMQNQLWMKQNISQKIKQKQQHLDWLDSRLQLQKPSNRIHQQAQRLDELNTRLQQRMSLLLTEKKTESNNYELRLNTNKPTRKLAENQKSLAHISMRLEQSIDKKIQQEQSNFKIKMAMLDSISPLKTLDRGYSIIKDSATGKLISSKNNLNPKQEITIRHKDGETNAKVI